MGSSKVWIGRSRGDRVVPGWTKRLRRRRRRTGDHGASDSAELISFLWFLGEGDVTLEVVFVLSLVSSVLPLTRAISSSAGLSSSSTTSSVVASLKSFLKGRSGGLVVQLLLKGGVALRAFDSAQLVGASSSLLTSSLEVSSPSPLFPGNLDLSLNLLDVEVRDIVRLADHLGQVVHGGRELGEDDKTFEMFRDGTLCVGHSSKVS